MSDNAATPKANPFTIWTRALSSKSAAVEPLISYPDAAPFTMWTKPAAPALISYPSPTAFTIWTKPTAPALITYSKANPFTIWTNPVSAAASAPILVSANNAFTIWAGKAPQPAPVTEPVAILAAETPATGGVPVSAEVASIFENEAEDEAEVGPVALRKTLMKWFAIPFVLLLGLIGFYQLNTEVKELTEDKTGLISEKETLIGEKTKLTVDLDGQRVVNVKLEEKNRTLGSQLTQTQIANKSLEEQAQDLKKEIGSLKGDVSKLKSDMADAITRHSEEAKKLNATIKEKVADIELKTAKISGLEESIKGNVMTIAAKDKEIAGLTGAVKTADGRIAELQQKTQMLSDELEGSLKKANSLTALLTDANKQLEATMAETTASAEKLRVDLKAMQVQTETLTNAKNAAEKRAEEMEQKAAAAIEAQAKAEATAAEALKKVEAAMAPAAEPAPKPAPAPQENIQTEAVAPVTPAAESVAIFNGKDLSGWEGDSRLWSVQDGCIVGETNDTDKKIETNTFLIWKGGEVGDFELTLKARITGENNSGVQYRSKLIDAAKWVVGGYQMDMHPKPEYFGMLYEEKGRGIVAQRGQKVNVTADGEKKVIGEVDMSKALDITQWNEYTITAKGNKVTHKVNGDVTIELVDDQESARAMSGILAFQVHAGPGMKVEMKDVKLAM